MTVPFSDLTEVDSGREGFISEGKPTPSQQGIRGCYYRLLSIKRSKTCKGEVYLY